MGCVIVFVAEAALLFVSLIMAAFASDSPKATDAEIGIVFLVVFGGPNLLAIAVYLIKKYTKRK